MSGPQLTIVADPDAGAVLVADRIARTLADAVDRRGRADWVTTGGSTPVGIYRRLAVPPLVGEVPWDRVHVWWTDDRFVPRDHPESNVKPFDDILLDIGVAEEGTAGGRTGVPLPFANIHPFRTGEAIGNGRGAGWCAAALADELRGAGLEQADGWPVFDLLLIGIGGDGHVLSVFPGSAAFDSTELALAIPAPTHIEPHIERVTLNPAVIAVARSVLVVSYGADKAGDPRRGPRAGPRSATAPGAARGTTERDLGARRGRCLGTSPLR